MALEINYKPPRSIEPFLFSEKFVSLIMGPYGSTKTTAGIIKIAYHASRMAPCKDGIRRSRAVWIRNTREILRDTSIPDFLKWFPDGEWGSYAKSEYRYILRFGDVECEVLFRSLDDSNDVRRLLSLQASFAIFDEFREIHPDIFHAMQGRLGRYPDASMNGVGCVTEQPATRCKHCWASLPQEEFILPLLERNELRTSCPECGKPIPTRQFNDHLWGMSNPPDMDTFWQRLLTDPPPNTDVIFQPSGMSPEADWLEYLPAGYYENLAQGKDQAWIDVYIHAKFGYTPLGEPVHRAFSAERHVASEPLHPMRLPLLIGTDAGLHPACLICQILPTGQLRVLSELVGQSGALQFVRNQLLPHLHSRYASLPAEIVIDPAAFQRSQTDERTVAQVFMEAGFKVRPAQTNALAARLSAVDDMLTRILPPNDEPAVLIDPSCKLLIDALSRKYVFKKTKKDEFAQPTPVKNHPYSDLVDSLHYVCMEANVPGSGWRYGVMGSTLQTERRVQVKPAPVRVF